MVYQLNLTLQKQPEGGYTITCKELPELITECDSLDEMGTNVQDAFRAVYDLYKQKKYVLPESIQITDNDIIETSVLFI